MQKITTHDLKQNADSILHAILETGESVEVICEGQTLLISTAKNSDSKLARIKPLKNLMNGDPADFEHIDWSDEWKI